ncbi:FliG C-terminal domain protein [Halobacteriovorax sp. BALOs_7]|uniref:FliG C-terminal domain-containing protein n=1 Tax=Halobacteriovorax sp. BALOs_7 TaxID=2109558 RepID=UPI000EA10F91|nr:FliG C-terminal domain-containing protein [Halobacteriovorax sp. BALOs_7]AYF44896.1 FliG C-terminal domain protein [Halobacteriovorax sp. BALOs_7]
MSNKKESGFKSILEAISLMNKEEKDTLIGNLSRMDAQLAQKLKANMYRLKDLLYITPKMLSEFLREVKTESFGNALKVVDEEVRSAILAKLPKSIRQDVEFYIDKKVPKSHAFEAHRDVMAVFTQMIDDERLIISKDDKTV